MKQKASIQGRYVWQLLFNFDNSQNTEKIVHSKIIETRKTVETKTFIKTYFNVSNIYKYAKEESVEVAYEGSKASEKIDYSFHEEIGRGVERHYTETTSFEEIKTITQNFTVGAGGKLSMYRLVFISDAGVFETETLATSPVEDIMVELDFSLSETILGFSTVLDILSNTTPGRSNATEWEVLRNDIIRESDHDAEKRFKYLVEHLQKFHPKTENTGEWASLRKTAKEIQTDWGKTDLNSAFRKLLLRLSLTYPNKDNTSEWAKIRDVTNSVYKNTVQLYV